MISEIWDYFKNPINEPYPDLQNSEKWSLLKKILILNIAFSFILGIVMGVVTTAAGADLGAHGVGEMFEKYPAYIIFFLAVILAPVVEELIFRGSLTFFKNPKYFKYAYYVSVFLFGAVHLSNFEAYAEHLWLAPVLVLPQISAGIFLGFTRVKLGLVWSMLLHGLHNGILLTPMLFFKFAGETIP
ncbi:CPBP family intramembrane glutamic endopeptidase [Cellulophaga sp. L1A9]|uniref:CPBP family intramembrane glutamic endopeptidase n=1 Tax=Cellulophaga sp. L1A9 TaxID=2686362 RepID=UPI00131E7F05|nr:CPBP family intramembrane glutamic endopeptidase [Cellulophaga sp. L1A9]